MTDDTPPAIEIRDRHKRFGDPQALRGIGGARAEGRTMLLVTHDMAMARDASDRVLFLHKGRIEEQGPPAQLFGAPKTARLQQFLSAVAA